MNRFDYEMSPEFPSNSLTIVAFVMDLTKELAPDLELSVRTLGDLHAQLGAHRSDLSESFIWERISERLLALGGPAEKIRLEALLDGLIA